MVEYPLDEPLVGIVWRVLADGPAQQIAAPGDGKAYRENELVAE